MALVKLHGLQNKKMWGCGKGICREEKGLEREEQRWGGSYWNTLYTRVRLEYIVYMCGVGIHCIHVWDWYTCVRLGYIVYMCEIGIHCIHEWDWDTRYICVRWGFIVYMCEIGIHCMHVWNWDTLYTCVKLEYIVYMCENGIHCIYVLNCQRTSFIFKNLKSTKRQNKTKTQRKCSSALSWCVWCLGTKDI